jgi:ABC-type uncharacterized transport system substrate-binding protein
VIDDPATESARAEAVRLGLRDLGYIEGQQIAFEFRHAEGKHDRLPEFAAELVRLKVDVLPAAARALGLTVRSWEVRVAEDFNKVFAALIKERPDGLYVHGRSPLIAGNVKRIVGLTSKSRLPSMYSNREAVDAGGLMSYGADLADRYRRVAYYVDRILKGAKPADLPVEQPTKFEFVINRKAAKQIGLTIPPNVLARADRVIR